MKRLLLVLLVLPMAVGCYSRLTGNTGNVVFAYRADTDITNFNKPIAPGAFLRIHTRAVGSNDELTVVEVKSHGPHVIDVEKSAGSWFEVRGRTVGGARLEVTVETADGRRLTDSVDMLVSNPQIVSMRHACTDETFAAYPANATMSIPFHLKRKSGEPVIGHGFTPVRIKPKTSLELVENEREPGVRMFRTGKPRHRVSIRSRIDDGILGLALVEPSEVDGFSLDAFGIGRTVVGGTTFVAFQPTVEDVPLCQSKLRIKATPKTPDICTATARLDDDQDGDTNTQHLVRIVGREFGWCEFEVTYPQAAGGDGITRRFEMPIGKFPEKEEAEESTEGSAPIWVAPLLALLAPLLLLPLGVRFTRRRR